MARDNYWTNQDGLVVGFGPHTADEGVSTQGSVKGNIQQVVLKIKGTELVDAGAPNAQYLASSVVIPVDAYLVSARLFVTTAFTSGGSAVLDIGVYDVDADAIEDDDGIDSAIAVATLVDNFDVACDGALVGSVLAQNSKIYASYDTAAFTAGEATLVVEYIPKLA